MLDRESDAQSFDSWMNESEPIGGDAPSDSPAPAATASPDPASAPVTTEAPAPGSSAAPDPATATPSPDTDPAASAAPDAATPAAEPQPPAPIPPSDVESESPFPLKVDGQSYEIDGAKLQTKRDGTQQVVVPVDSWNRFVVHRLADRPTWQRKEQALRKELTTAQQALANDPEKLTARALVTKLRELATEPNEEAAWAAFQQFRQNLPLAERDARIAALTEAQTRREAEEAETRKAESYQQVVPLLSDNLKTWVSHYAGLPEFKGLDVEKVHQRLWRFADRLYRATGQTDATSGLPQFDIDREFLEDELREATRTERVIAERAKAIEEAAKLNAAKNNPPPIPASASAKGAPVTGSAAPKTYAPGKKGAREWDDDWRDAS